MDERNGLEELRECLLLSASEDWKTRLKGEYWETKIRCRKLEAAIREQEGQEDALDAAQHIMRKQLDNMVSYLSCLALQAAVADIDLQDVELPEGTCSVLVSGSEKDVWICSTGRTDACLIASVHALGRVAVAALCVLIKKCEEAEA